MCQKAKKLLKTNGVMSRDIGPNMKELSSDKDGAVWESHT